MPPGCRRNGPRSWKGCPRAICAPTLRKRSTRISRWRSSWRRGRWRWRSSTNAGSISLTLLTKDRPALFASVAGAISSFGLNILKAEAFSNTAGMVLDTFTFADPHRTLELNPPEVDRLRGVVRKVVEGKQDADKLLRGRPKPLLVFADEVRPRVSFKDDASDGARWSRSSPRTGPACCTIWPTRSRRPAATSRW